METTIVYWGYIGIMEKKMETTIVSWGSIKGKIQWLSGDYIGLWSFKIKVIHGNNVDQGLRFRAYGLGRIEG